jgi:predicted RNA methylase
VFNSIKLAKSATVIDLGSGDGKVLLLAAQKGYSAIGYELNPFLVLISKWRLRKYPNAKVVMKDMWQADVTEADLVFTFLATKYMERLKTQIVSKMKKGSYFASYAFEIPDLELLRKTQGVNTYKL